MKKKHQVICRSTVKYEMVGFDLIWHLINALVLSLNSIEN